MDLASIIGFIIVAIGVFVGMIMKGADPVQMFTNVAALMVVWMGCIGATVASYSLAENIASLKAFKKIFMPGAQPEPAATIDTLMTMADKARREGLLGLEDMTKDMKDPFLQRGVQLAVDGTDAATIQESLTAEVKAMKERHKVVATWFTAAGIFAPTFGIIGAVIGLIAVMSKLDDPAALGHGIAAAFVATFWGVYLANAMFLPWASRLKRLSADEVAQKEIVIQGVMALQSGMTPRALGDRLYSYLPPSQRKAS